MDNILLAKFEPSALAEPSAVQPTHESCDESEDDEWKYTKEGQGEKQLGLQGDTVVEEDLLPQEQQEAAAKFSLHERKASGNILQQQISINTSNLIESMNDTYEGLTQNITELNDQAVASVTGNTEDQNEQNLNLSQSSTREKLDNIVDDEEDPNEMNSRLNPEAKEFIPTFSPPLATKENGFAAIVNPAATAIPAHFKDEVISQSPRKGRESDMDNINIPAENEFDAEIAHKPHELAEDNIIIHEIPSNGRALFQEMNWKEANHGSEKEEGPLVDSPVTEESPQPVVENNQQNFGVCELSAPVGLENAGMKDSIYIENNSPNEDLNTVQVIPKEFIESGSDSNKEENDAASKDYVQVILKECELQPVSAVELTPKVEKVEASPVDEVPEPVIVEKDEKVEQQPVTAVEPEVAPVPASTTDVSKEAGLSLGGAAAVVAATAVASVAAATVAAVTSASKKVEDEKNQKNLKKNTSATKPKVPDMKKPAVSSTVAAKRTLTDKTKPATAPAAAAAAIKKTTGSTLSTAPRPKTAPTATAAKTAGTDKKTPTSSTTSTVKSRADAKPPTTLANRKPLSSSAAAKPTASKPDDETKSTSSTVKSSTGGKSTLTSKSSAGSTKASATNSTAKLRSSTASSAASVNGVATKTTSATKPTTLAPKSAGAAAGKASTTSPRGTVTSTLRKTEAVKSPTKTTSSTITSRISTNGVTKSTTTTRTTTTSKTTPSTGSTTTTRTTTSSRLGVTGVANPTSKTTTTNSVAAARKSTPLKKTTTTTTTTNSTTPTARKSIGNKLNSPATKTKDSTTPKPIKKSAAAAVGAQKQQKTENSTPEVPAAASATAALAEESNKTDIVAVEEPKLNGNASPDDVSLLPSTETAAPVAAHPLIEMETA